MAVTKTSRFDYLIIGGGMVANYAAEGIRERDDDGTIGILSEDVDAPYPRPALSKKLWTDTDFSWADADLHTAENNQAALFLETSVVSIDREARCVETSDGERFHYDTLLLATGGRPTHVELPVDERVVSFRTARDYRRLREIAATHPHVAVVGGGYLGTELAAALVENGCEVTLITPDHVLGGSVFPAEHARHFHDLFETHGVHIRTDSRVSGGSADASGISMDFDDGSSLDVGAVVSGLGIKPNVELARDSGLMVGDGIVVDEYLRTSDHHIFAAGDVAEYPDVLLGRRRVEHVDNAVVMGHVAGRNMTGDPQPYDHTPYFYSVLFGVRYEAVGIVDATFDVVEDWTDPYVRGVVYYLRDGRVAGIVLWNIEGRITEAREVLAHAESLSRLELPGRIRP